MGAVEPSKAQRDPARAGDGGVEMGHRGEGLPHPAGKSVLSGSSSVLTGPPSRVPERGVAKGDEPAQPAWRAAADRASEPVNAVKALIGHASLRSTQIYTRAAGHHVHQAAHVLPVRQQIAESAAMIGHRPARHESNNPLGSSSAEVPVAHDC